MRQIRISLDDEIVKVWAQKIKGDVWVHYKGKTFVYESKKKSKAAQLDAGTANPGVILAPMPGKIIKVNFSEGEEVKQGDVLLVMEAMKMEYSLSSDVDGIVKELNCEKDQQVNLGEVLAQVET